jgi:hypothetical protein
MMISQEYFDEVCLENAQLFDLSEEESLRETLEQFSDQDLRHIVSTFPSAKDTQREARQAFQEALAELNDDNLEANLDLIREKLQENPSVYARLIVVHQGFTKLVPLLSKDGALETILAAFDKKDREVLQSFHASAGKSDAVQQWLELYSGSSSSTVLLTRLHLYACWACKHCEVNKKSFMGHDTLNLPNLWMDHLQACLESDKTDPDFVVSACRLLTVVCTFDDFAQNQAGPTLASTHANVQAFHAAGAISFLQRLLTMSNPSTRTAVVLALRSLAIHDETVQVMVAGGILDRVNELFANDGASLELQTACLGLFRNVCANDEIKCRLCTGNQSIVPAIMDTMMSVKPSDGPNNSVSLLLEHGCGTIAAMALRQPRNAAHLVGHRAGAAIVRAMKLFPDRVTLQRQASLALRNLASRADENVKQTLLQGRAQQALLEVAARHVGCQDEVYAALRDLGVSVNCLHIQTDASGKSVVLQQREMFGQGNNSNFRAVYE